MPSPPEDQYAATAAPGSPWASSARELTGVRGAHLVDRSTDPSVKTAWQTTTGRADVVISVLDSGILWNSALISNRMKDLRRKVHQTIQRVTFDIERIHLNTAVAAFHELVNEIYRLEAEVAQEPGRAVLREALETLILLLNPFTPHVCEEMGRRLGRAEGLVRAPWPAADEAAAREDAVELAVQVNGKVRGRITVPREAGEEAVRGRALEEPRVAEMIKGKEVVKVVVVPGRLVSVVTR